MTLTQAAASLGVSPRTLRIAIERGEITGEHPLPDGPWVLHRSALEADVVAKFVERVSHRRQEGGVLPTQQQSFAFSTT
jgi:hypothetical protein